MATDCVPNRPPDGRAPAGALPVHGGSTSWPVVILLELALALVCGAFARLVVFRKLASGTVDTALALMLPDCLARCYVFLVLGAVGLTAFFYFDLHRPGAGATRRGRQLLGILALSVFLYYLILTRALQFPVSGDDSYIDYRHVRNLVDRFSLNYNQGQRVMGFTSHLHLWMLSLLAVVTRAEDLSVLSVSTNLVVQAVNYVLIFLLLRRITGSGLVGVLGAMLYALWPYELRQATFGKEGPIVELLMLGAVWAVRSRRIGPLAWCGALLFLARPEGILWLALAAGWSLRQRGLRALKPWLVPLGIVAAWYVLLVVHFGSPLPHGALAKKLMYHGDRPWTAFMAIVAHVCEPLGLPWAFPYVPQLVLVAGAAWVLWKDDAGLRFYGLGAVLTLGFFTATHPHMFGWYLAWFAPLFWLAVPLLAWRAWAWAAARRAWIYRGLAAAGIAYLALVPLRALPARAVGPVEVPNPLFYWDDVRQRLVLYARAADYLNYVAPHGAVAAVPETGIFGYVYRGQVLDLGGLVSPKMLRFYPVPPSQRSDTSNYSIPPKAIREVRPDYIVTYDTFAKGGMLNDEFFLSHYKQIRFWPLEIWKSKGLYAYKLVSPPATRPGSTRPGGPGREARD